MELKISKLCIFLQVISIIYMILRIVRYILNTAGIIVDSSGIDKLYIVYGALTFIFVQFIFILQLYNERSTIKNIRVNTYDKLKAAKTNCITDLIFTIIIAIRSLAGYYMVLSGCEFYIGNHIICIFMACVIIIKFITNIILIKNVTQYNLPYKEIVEEN